MFVFFFFFMCNDVCRVLRPGVYCCLLSPSNIIYTVSTHLHTHKRTHTRSCRCLPCRESEARSVPMCVFVCVCVCGCTSTGVCRLIKFISSGHVAAGNQCCEGKRPRRQSVCVCVCACVCKPVYLCVSLGRRMANISTADDPLLLTHTRSRWFKSILKRKSYQHIYKLIFQKQQ